MAGKKVKNKPKYVVISNIIGIVLIIVAVLFNELVVAFLFSEDKEISLSWKKLIRIFDGFCFITGILFLKQKVFPLYDIIEKKLHNNIFLRRLVVILIFMPLIIFPIFRGIFSPYYGASDQDILLISQSLFYNAGMEPTYFDHPGYINYLIIGVWIKFNYWLGLVPVSDMQQLFNYVNENGFGAAMAPLVYSGRVLAMILTVVFLVSFIYGVYRLYNNWGYALLYGLLLSSSIGLMVHSLILRTELLSAYFFMLFLLLFLFIITKDRFRITIFFFAGFFAYLSILAKIQIIMGILSAPLLMLAYNNEVKNSENDRGVYLEYWKSVVGLCAIISTPFLISIIKIYYVGQYTLTGDYELVTHQASGAWHYLLIPLLLVLYAILFKYIRKISLKMTLVSISMVFAGIASGYYLHMIWYDERFISNILFFYERGKYFIGPGWIPQNEIHLLSELPEIIKGVIVSKFNPVVYINRPFTLLYPFIIIAIIISFIRLNSRKAAFRSLLLVLFSLGLEILFHIRLIGHPSIPLSNLVNMYPAVHYSIFIEFLIIFSIVQLFASQDQKYSVARTNSKEQDIILERVLLKKIMFLVILSVTLLNLIQNFIRIKQNNIGIALNQTPHDFVQLSRMYIYPLNDYLNDKCGNDCEKYLLKGQ